MTRRLDFFFEKKRWLTELKFLEHESRIEFLSFFEKKKKTTQRIELFSKIRYKELNFFSIWLNFFFKIWLEEFNPSFYHDSKTLLLFLKKKSKNLTFMTHRLEPFFFLNIFSKKRLKELSLFFELWLSKCIFLSTNATHGTDFFFSIRLTELIFFFEYDFFFDIELFFFWIRLKELKSPIRLRGITFFLWYVSMNSTSLSYELFLHNSKNLTFLFSIRVQIFFKMSQRVELFFEYDS